MWLLERAFERFSHFTQKWVGVDCFFWSGVSHSLSALFLLFLSQASPGIIIPFLFAYEAMKDLTSIYNLPKVREKIYRDLSKGYENRLKMLLQKTRTSVLKFKIFFMTPLVCVAFILFGVNIVTLFFLLNYFQGYLPLAFKSCTPLSPRESEVKKGIRKIGQALSWEPSGPLPA